ncbi:MAG: phosphatidylglycerophosphatase A [Candidatus Marinimicrobia bacterium]|nr:phosphatidylglycerophosphatase A [Candidatus Neomarinimicrobiota bacterium]
MKRKFSLNYLFATFFYVGFIPFAPGSWGTLAGLLFWLFLPVTSIYIKLYLIIATYLTGILVTGRIERKENLEDPGFIVIDEVVGIWIAMLFIPAHLSRDVMQLAIAFFGFRFFDIIKIPPIRQAEKFEAGLGIMTDDLIAGLFTGIVIFLVNFLR